MNDPHSTDVLIVGAGPAGSVLAFLLAGRGWRVTLLDKAHFPRPKPCGECLNPGAVAGLERVGLLETVMALDPVPLEGWRIRSADGNGGTGRFASDTRGFGVSRSALDHALVQAAVGRGARLEEGVRVRQVSLPGRGAAPAVETIVEWGERRTRHAHFLVGADGLRSVVARRLGMVGAGPGGRKISLTCRLRGFGPPRTTGFLQVGDVGTVGLAPVVSSPACSGHDRDRLWNGTVVVDASRGPEMKGDAEGFFRSVFDDVDLGWSHAEYDVVEGPWPSGSFDWPARRVTGRRLLLVGDAAGYFDPLTGQGIFRAVRSAELAAEAIDRSLLDERESEAALASYAHRLERAFRPGRRIQRVIEGVLSRPRLREAALKRIGSTAGGLDALIRVTGDVAPARSLARPGLLLSLAGFPGLHRRSEA